MMKKRVAPTGIFFSFKMESHKVLIQLIATLLSLLSLFYDPFSSSLSPLSLSFLFILFLLSLMFFNQKMRKWAEQKELLTLQILLLHTFTGVH